MIFWGLIFEPLLISILGVLILFFSFVNVTFDGRLIILLGLLLFAVLIIFEFPCDKFLFSRVNDFGFSFLKRTSGLLFVISITEHVFSILWKPSGFL